MVYDGHGEADPAVGPDARPDQALDGEQRHLGVVGDGAGQPIGAASNKSPSAWAAKRGLAFTRVHGLEQDELEIDRSGDGRR